MILNSQTRFPSWIMSILTSSSIFGVFDRRIISWEWIIFNALLATVLCVVFRNSDFRNPLVKKSPLREVFIFLNFITLQVAIYAIGNTIMLGFIVPDLNLHPSKLQWLVLGVLLYSSLISVNGLVGWLNLKRKPYRWLLEIGTNERDPQDAKQTVNRMSWTHIIVLPTLFVTAALILREATLILAFICIPLQVGFYKAKQYKNSLSTISKLAQSEGGTTPSI